MAWRRSISLVMAGIQLFMFDLWRFPRFGSLIDASIAIRSAVSSQMPFPSIGWFLAFTSPILWSLASGCLWSFAFVSCFRGRAGHIFSEWSSLGAALVAAIWAQLWWLGFAHILEDSTDSCHRLVLEELTLLCVRINRGFIVLNSCDTLRPSLLVKKCCQGRHWVCVEWRKANTIIFSHLKVFLWSYSFEASWSLSYADLFAAFWIPCPPNSPLKLCNHCISSKRGQGDTS